MRVHINAIRCVDYLRDIGVEVSETEAERWIATEAETRAARRAGRRERKRSCGHFRSHWTRVFAPTFVGNIRYCSDCGVTLETRPDPPPKGRKPIPTKRSA